MREITGIIDDVSRGEVTILLPSGTKLKWKGSGDFKYGEAVVVLYDHCNLRVNSLMRPKELYKEDFVAPKAAHHTYQYGEGYPVEEDEGGSFPLPAVAPEEYDIGEEREQEWE